MPVRIIFAFDRFMKQLNPLHERVLKWLEWYIDVSGPPPEDTVNLIHEIVQTLRDRGVMLNTN